MSEEDLLNLEPKILWKYFNELRKIPRGSRDEGRVAEFIFTTAKSLEFEVVMDDMKNVLVKVPASPGCEEKPVTCLQAHMDMVCEKNSNVVHDFSKDPLDVYIDGEYVTARGTTLGADNGIGVAAMLALLEDKESINPPLELLFTVSEEMGLEGASALKEDFLEAHLFINLDGEGEGTIYIGCAGGGDTGLYFPFKKIPAVNEGLRVKIHGLKGGHSGVDIHLGRANAIKILARALYRLMEVETVELSSIVGGNKRNAIPREAEALITVKDTNTAKKILKKNFEDLKNEYEGKDDHMEVEVQDTPVKEVMIDGEKVIQLLLSLPHGVLSMNPFLEELVDTSTNLAVIQTSNEKVEIYHKTRSSIISAIEDMRRVFKAIGRLAGMEVVQESGYPPWKPNIKSPLLKIAKETYQEMYGKDVEVKAIHGGLETAVIGGKFPRMDMISIGATLNFPHSPDERVLIVSVKKSYDYLKGLLKTL